MTKRLVMLAAIIVLAGCSTGGPGDSTPAIDETAQPSPTATASAPGVFIQEGVPQATIQPALDKLIASGYVQVDAPENAVVQFTVGENPDAVLTTQVIYALVAPFQTVPDAVAWNDLKAFWLGQSDSLPPFEAQPTLVVPVEVIFPMVTLLDKHAETVQFTDKEGKVGSGLYEQISIVPDVMTILPFDQLEPRWKVLTIDGLSPLDKSLNVDAYPLKLTVGVTADDSVRDTVIGLLEPDWQTTNRDPSKISSVVMTGVTALTRSTAWYIENEGADFPSLNIAPFFADHDILHVSSEVSFTPKCPPPDLFAEKFCAKPSYLDVLTLIGVDIVELTGNHNNDFGINADLFTLDLFDQTGIPFYGGGRNVEEAMKPHILTTPDGTRVAFVGCNSTGPFPAYATAETPGAAPCGDWAWIKQAIHDLKANNLADVVIATVQYHESQSYTPEEQQVPDFAALADAGADIVSGSQAHVPQGFLVTPTSFIHYGVGNLFFDQMDFIENRQMFADKHILYGGRHISTVLFTGIIEDYSQPRPMTPQERADFLKLIFSAGGS
jgi:capsule synthesis protein PGA_cap